MQKIILLFLLLTAAACGIFKNCPTSVCTDTVTVHKTVLDTVAFVSIERRDTIPIFKGTAIFIGSSVDSISRHDSMRYYVFEIMNYGAENYIPTAGEFLKIVIELEVKNTIMRSDTIVLPRIDAHEQIRYVQRYPLRWFKGPPTRGASYHYRIKLLNQSGKTLDAWYPLPLNEALPVKKYMEVYGDTVIYWKRPVIVEIPDTTIIIKPPVEKPAALIANWKFNTDGADVTGKHNAALNSPAMIVTNTMAEGAASLSLQASDYFANCGVMPITDEFSIAFWFQTYNSGSTNRVIVSTGNWDYPNGFAISIDEAMRAVKFCTGNGTARNFLLTNTAAYDVGAWNHVVITGNRITGTGAIFINGVNKTAQGANTIFKTFGMAGPLIIGRSSNGEAAWLFIDDARIYDRALSQVEIMRLFSKLELY